MTDCIDRRGTRLSLCGAGSDGRLVIRFAAQERIGYKKIENGRTAILRSRSFLIEMKQLTDPARKTLP